ncbi:uncharacterized protein LOC119683004 [Teleopsis dalmanni]|uniref:uncharacterized protein LOC119683004 n=1 Tax=Teleopsis dalmanni TaxID=139649 RepID=UPI0018CD9CBA|nr:uncharacterized protein LOC119683004 [Teleopsis dalmanni]
MTLRTYAYIRKQVSTICSCQLLKHTTALLSGNSKYKMQYVFLSLQIACTRCAIMASLQDLSTVGTINVVAKKINLIPLKMEQWLYNNLTDVSAEFKVYSTETLKLSKKIFLTFAEMYSYEFLLLSRNFDK